MHTSFQSLIDNTNKEMGLYKPVFFRLKDKKDKAEFIHLIENKPGLKIFNQLESQVSELIKLRSPKKKFKSDELKEATKQHIGANVDEYGVWVYYPWSSQLAHILDEEEFVEVRTSRNQYKITLKEQKKLSNIKIGIIGLSVGQSVAITMAMERACGELRLADFDLLELSNLNRVKAGVCNLGISKVISIAREIAEIDPFLTVKCYDKGVTEENIDDFLCEGGTLDLLVDECDGLDIKVLCRKKAKAYKIPVVMEANDRCSVDVERFDIDPNRPIFHGLIEHLDTTGLKNLTNEEKIPFLLSIHPPEDLSKRIKASMLEVDESITTWPQLASSVMLGGGVVTDVCRRIVLDQFRDSGRYFIDLEEIISDKKPDNTPKDIQRMSPLTLDEMHKTISMLPSSGKVQTNLLDNDTLNEIVNAAVLAPTGGNSQPWKWLYHNAELFLFFDKSRSMSFMDYRNISSYIGLGAALENLDLKARSLSLEAKIILFPLDNDDRLIAKITFEKKEITPQPKDDLVQFIPKRCTNRRTGERKEIGPDILDNLLDMVRQEKGANLFFIEHPEHLKGIAEIVGKAERIRLLNPQSHKDFFTDELRWTPAQSTKTNDGVDVATMSLSRKDILGMHIIKDPEVMKLLKQWGLGNALLKTRQKHVNSASAIGLITIPSSSKKDYVNGGRLMERVWLETMRYDLGFQPLFVPITLFQRLDDKDTALSKDLLDEVKKMRVDFFNYFPEEVKGKELILFRVCRMKDPEVKSLRKPVNEVLFTT